MEKLLIADGTEDVRSLLMSGFSGEYQVLLARTAPEAVGLFVRHRPKGALLDLGLPPADNGPPRFCCLRELLAANPYAKMITVGESGDAATAAQAIEAGAYDHLQKPVDIPELKVIVRRALHLAVIEEENRKLRTMLDRKGGAMTGIVGQSPAMLAIFSTIRKVAGSDAAVLIQGESGTGKELIARTIHAASPRRTNAFVAMHCSAVPEGQLESELFGLEQDREPLRVRGRMEHARGGTLFLDEMEELPRSLQVKLAGVLKDKIIRRPGPGGDIPVDARIIAATDRPLNEDIRNHRFREDLYYRVGVVTLQLPPLRERKEDIMLLASLFLVRFGNEVRKRIRGFTTTSLALMEDYSWPGNVRELESRVQRAVILAEGPLIEPADLGFTARPPSVSPAPLIGLTTLKDARDRIERQLVMQAMDRRRGNIAQAAEDLGISRPTLYDIMKKHGLFHMSHPGSRAQDNGPNKMHASRPGCRGPEA